MWVKKVEENEGCREESGRRARERRGREAEERECDRVVTEGESGSAVCVRTVCVSVLVSPGAGKH